MQGRGHGNRSCLCPDLQGGLEMAGDHMLEASARTAPVSSCQGRRCAGPEALGFLELPGEHGSGMGSALGPGKTEEIICMGELAARFTDKETEAESSEVSQQRVGLDSGRSCPRCGGQHPGDSRGGTGTAFPLHSVSSPIRSSTLGPLKAAS